MEKNKASVLFDGDCGICTAFAGWAGRLDRRKKFEIVPYQNFPEEELSRWGTSPQKTAHRMHVLTPGGRNYTGAFALNYFGWQFLPWRLLVIMIYALPVFLLLEILAYALVAKHRHRISQWLGLQACATKRPLESTSI